MGLEQAVSIGNNGKAVQETASNSIKRSRNGSVFLQDSLWTVDPNGSGQRRVPLSSHREQEL